MTVRRTSLAMLAALAAVASAGLAPTGAAAQLSRATPGQAGARTLLDLAPAGARLSVTSPAFADGGDIPFENTQYRGNVFPGLAWTAGPAATRSYAIVMQDNSLLWRGAPILHWTLFNIPAAVTRLDPGLTAPPAGAVYGPSYKGLAQPYAGPHTPPGPKDSYHFEVFALDAALPPGAGASFEALVGAMTGHVLAGGEVVGLGRKDPDAAGAPAK